MSFSVHLSARAGSISKSCSSTRGPEAVIVLLPLGVGISNPNPGEDKKRYLACLRRQKTKIMGHCQMLSASHSGAFWGRSGMGMRGPAGPSRGEGRPCSLSQNTQTNRTKPLDALGALEPAGNRKERTRHGPSNVCRVTRVHQSINQPHCHYCLVSQPQYKLGLSLLPTPPRQGPSLQLRSRRGVSSPLYY